MTASLIANWSFAQEAPATFTLEQCIEYALKNSINAQNAVIDQQIAAAKVRETVGIGLPQISGSVQLVHNPQLQRFFSQFNPGGGFIDFSGIPGIKPGDVVAAQNFFQLKNSGTASVTVNQLLFSGSYLVGLQASKTYKELSYKAAVQNKEQIVQQVTKAYYGVLINKERIKLFDNSITRVDSLLRNVTALNKNGFAESIDVDRVKVTYNNLKAEQEKFLNLNELGLELLKFQMNYPLDQNLVVAGNIQDMNVDVSTLVTYQDGWDYKIRSDYKYLETTKHLQELSIKNLKAESLPTLSAFGTFGYSTQSDSFGGLFSTNSGIKDQNGAGPDSWYDYSLVGISLNVPIFNGLQNRYKIQQQRFSMQKIENNFKALRQGIDLETKTANIQFKNAIASMGSQKENMELASNIARITKIKYEQGVGSNLEVVDAENSLRQAQTNYYSALYDAMVAKVDLDKAYGKLIPSTTK